MADIDKISRHDTKIALQELLYIAIESSLVKKKRSNATKPKDKEWPNSIQSLIDDIRVCIRHDKLHIESLIREKEALINLLSDKNNDK